MLWTFWSRSFGIARTETAAGGSDKQYVLSIFGNNNGNSDNKSFTLFQIRFSDQKKGNVHIQAGGGGVYGKITLS